MPHHLIYDAHEQINEFPAVATNYLGKPQAREWAGNDRQGKKTFLSLTLTEEIGEV